MKENRTYVSVERHDIVSTAPFDDVVAAVKAGLGQPDFPAFERHLLTLTQWPEYHDAVEAQAGSAGLMVFLELDIGHALAIDPDVPTYRSLRLIAGNPVTMASVAGTAPVAASFAPVTILVYEAADGVHLVYDTMLSSVPELTNGAAKAGAGLDAEVLGLLRSAAGSG